jgi:monovalent cation:H+ antiporter-2, CPA2 family
MFILRDVAMVLMAALLAGLLFWRLRQPLILGYVVAGLVLSPLTPGPHVQDVHTFEVMAEVGVILLMFSVGIEFSIPELLRVKWVALIGAPIGISISIGLGVAAGRLLGWPLLQSVACGAIICVASTMVLSRLLMDRGELSSESGRVMFTITLVEDLAVIILTVVLPALGSAGAGYWTALWTIGKAFLFLAPVVFIAWKIMPGIAARVARTCNEEIAVLLALTTCLVIAAFTEAVGLSLALGAFVAGLLIGNSGYAHELAAKTIPFRDAFVAVFFVTIGMLIDLRTIFSNWRILATMVALIVVGKFAVWFTVVRLFGYPARTALRVGIGLTQIGELSFILAQVALQSRLIAADVYNATLAASLITILINAALFGLLKPVPFGPASEQEAPGHAFAAPTRA